MGVPFSCKDYFRSVCIRDGNTSRDSQGNRRYSCKVHLSKTGHRQPPISKENAGESSDVSECAADIFSKVYLHTCTNVFHLLIKQVEKSNRFTL